MSYLPLSQQIHVNGMTYMPFDTYSECMEIVKGAQKELEATGDSSSGLYCLPLQIAD
jgi:hypothetical protein